MTNRANVPPLLRQLGHGDPDALYRLAPLLYEQLLERTRTPAARAGHPVTTGDLPEIAATLDVSVSTVGRDLRFARAPLAEAWDTDG